MLRRLDRRSPRRCAQASPAVMGPCPDPVGNLGHTTGTLLPPATHKHRRRRSLADTPVTWPGSRRRETAAHGRPHDPFLQHAEGRQRPGRDGHRAVQGRTDPPPWPLEGPRPDRVRHLGVGRLVQPPPAAGADRACPTGRVRGRPLEKGDPRHHRRTQAPKPPVNPGRFTRPRAPPHGRHSANGPCGGTSEPGLSPAARGAERHTQPVMGGIAGMDPALHAAQGPTGTVPT